MQVLIDNKTAVIKDDQEVEINLENPQFGDAETYSMCITFPMKGCPENIKIFGRINRKDVEIGRIRMSCRIQHRQFVFSGVITVTEISDVVVKGQFLAGRSICNFDDTLDSVEINTLDVGDFWNPVPVNVDPRNWMKRDPTTGQVIIPWGFSETGIIQNEVCMAQIYGDGHWRFIYSAATREQGCSSCIFLYDLTKRIIEELGFKANLEEWKSSHLYDLLMLNTMPAAWGIKRIQYVLPSWTAQKFFSQLGLFLGGEFVTDFTEKTITFNFTSSQYSTLTQRLIEIIDTDIDSFTVTSTQEDESDFIQSANLRYSGGSDDTVYQEDNCDWLIESHKGDIDVYDTMQELIEMAKALPRRDDCFDNGKMDSKYPKFDRIAYCKETSTYFYIKIGCDWIVKDLPFLRNLYKNHSAYISKLNVFGNRFGKEVDGQPVTDLEIVPVSVSNDPNGDWWTPLLGPGEVSENLTGSEAGDVIWLDKADAIQNSKFQTLLAAGEPSESISLYSQIFVGYWLGPDVHVHINNNDLEFNGVLPPLTDWMIKTGPYNFKTFDKKYSMRLNDGTGPTTPDYKIDPYNRYEISFLANKVPDQRSIFIIRGKKFICSKLTVKISKEKVSSLIKGYFYQVKE